MTASPLFVLGTTTRSLEWLGGPAAFLSSTALSTAQLSELGPLASLIEGAAGPSADESNATILPDAVTGPANQAVLTTHAQIEGVADQVAPLNGPLHGVTNLGETLGLGHLGEGGNLLTDAGGIVTAPTDPAAAAPLLSDAAHVTDAAGSLADSVLAAPASGNGLVGSGSALAPAQTLLNQTILDTHASLEQTGHEIPILNDPIHAVTGLGETIGLGHLGESGNLLTDLSTVPGSLLGGGGFASASPILTDLSPVLGAVDTLTGSLTGLTAASTLLSADSPLAPITNLANVGVLNLHSSLETVGHEITPLNDAIHGLTNLGETIGLGHIGESSNLVTDVAALPGDLLNGQGTGGVTPILTDVGSVVTATGGLLGGVTGLAGGLGGTEAPLTGVLAPVTSTVGGLLNTAEGGSGTGGLLDGVTGHLGGADNPLGGALAPVTSTVGSLLGGLGGTGNAGDTHPLVEVGAGPTTDAPAANVGVLAPDADTTHAVQVNAGAAPADQPSLIHAVLLAGDSLALPQTGDGGDSLVGQLRDIAPVSALAPAEVGASHGLLTDLGLASIDLGAHAQASHTDPTPHTDTTGLHLLGL